jgi:ATP-dependent RNA helicase DeaD
MTTMTNTAMAVMNNNETHEMPAVSNAPSFADFNLPAKLMQSLQRMQFSSPTPIQAACIPLAMQGRDILGSAQTGTGKTAAFGIPMIAKMMENENGTALILTPTRELATQVLATLVQLIPVQNMKTALLIGGEPLPRQFRQLQGNPRVIVGTPGRVNDHLMRGTLKLGNTRFLVLDETDRMLDMGFGVQLAKIIKHIPAQRQTMMFSATIPGEIAKLSGQYLNNPQRVAIGSSVAPAIGIKQEQIQTSDHDKYQQLLAQLTARTGSIIVFVKTKFGAARLADKLCVASHRAEAIHGNLKQGKRDKVIQGFRDRKYRILVATDVAARGLDVPHIEHVINYDLPQCPEDYIHRIGRTARAGAVGTAVNLITPSDGEKWRAIYRLMNPGEKMPPGARQDNNAPGGRKPHGKGRRHFGNRRRGSGGGGGGQGRPHGDRHKQAANG